MSSMKYKIKTGKYLGDKQVYSIKDFLEAWKANGFKWAWREGRKKTETYYFDPKS